MADIEGLGLLSDAEVSYLSDRMTPVEFDRIPLQYLLIKKVRDMAQYNSNTIYIKKNMFHF